MRLYEEIFKSAEGVAFSRCIFVPKGGGYFEGVKAVDDFSPTRRRKGGCLLLRRAKTLKKSRAYQPFENVCTFQRPLL